jgi:hypothetical protein
MGSAAAGLADKSRCRIVSRRRTESTILIKETTENTDEHR